MRERYNGFIERHDVAWELGMALLAVVYVAIGFALDEPGLASSVGVLGAVELLLTVVFLAEFATRIVAANDRPAYVRRHWIDLIALVPAARQVRVLRLVRLLRLVRSFAGVYRALGHIGSLAEQRGLQIVVLSWLAVMLICCAAIYFAERGVNDAMTSPFDALWWGVTTMTTVGYGDVVPKTAEGRIAASALMLLGIGLFSAVTAIITSFLLDRGRRQRNPMDDLERLARLANEGLIGEAEFASKRTELLARL